LKNLFIFLAVASVFSLDASSEEQDRLASSLAKCKRALHLFNAEKFPAVAIVRARSSCRSLCMEILDAYPGTPLSKAFDSCETLFSKNRSGSPSNQVVTANNILSCAQAELDARSAAAKK